MKRILPLLSILFVLFQSCSSSDSDSPSQNSILIKRIVQTTPQAEYISDFTYNGLKMVQSIQTAPNFLRRGVYTYTGNLITKIEYFNIDNALFETRIFNYNTDNKIASMIKLLHLSGNGIRVTFTHNSDGSVTAIGYNGDLINQNTLEYNNTITFFSNGEISSMVENMGVQILTCSYDNKNNPFKNVIGFDEISYANEGFFATAINHNLTQTNSYRPNIPVYTTNFTYTYNSDDFPLSQTYDNLAGLTTYTYY